MGLTLEVDLEKINKIPRVNASPTMGVDSAQVAEKNSSVNVSPTVSYVNLIQKTKHKQVLVFKPTRIYEDFELKLSWFG